ncbi:MAG: hypothetical protein PVH82_14225 [Desulfobacteraceae bacterium]
MRKEAPILLSEKESKEFTIAIGGIGVSFFFDQDLSETGIEDRDDAFVAYSGEDLRLRVHYRHFSDIISKERIFDSGDTWALYKSNGRYVLQDDSLESASSPSTFVVLNPDLRSGDVFILDDAADRNPFPDPIGYPLNQVLMILLLSLGKGILFHACGIDDDGSGYLFLGNSTDGKSTMAGLWSKKNATVLNDDRIVVREKDGEFWMYGTPWHGDFREISPEGLPIKKIFFLRHGESNSAAPKNGIEAVTMLLTRSFPPLWDKNGMTFTTGLCHHIVNKVPCYELSFAPDTKIVDFVRNF